jgi:dihydroxy-acid dehydratase
MAMDTEEMSAALPVDAVVLIGGCDKTVPAQLMGAVSAGKPAIQLVTGFDAHRIAPGPHRRACTDCGAFWGRYRAEEIDTAEITEVNGRLVGSVGPARWPAPPARWRRSPRPSGSPCPAAPLPQRSPRTDAVAEATGTRAVGLARGGA